MFFWKLKKFAEKHRIKLMAGAAAVVVVAVLLIVFLGGKPVESVSAAIETPSLTVQAPASETPDVSLSPEQSVEPSESAEASPEVSTSPDPSPSPSPSPSKKPKETAKKPVVKKVKPKLPSLDKLVKDFEVKEKKYYGGFSSNHYEYTDKELRMLAVVIYREAKNQPYACQVAVGNVVMNRVLASGYPGSNISDVVTRPNQFAYLASVTPNSECIRVARDILDNEVWTVPQNTYFFRANSSTSDWGGHKYYKHLGNTAFYTDRYSGRSNGSAVPEALFERVYRWPQYGCKPASRVRKIQIMLRSFGYKVGTDGYFGADTKKALMKFQKSKKVKADGVAGPSTIKAIIKKYGIEKYLKL
jgi:spore germination cell wall hydrolase CwlJ-like protein